MATHLAKKCLESNRVAIAESNQESCLNSIIVLLEWDLRAKVIWLEIDDLNKATGLSDYIQPKSSFIANFASKGKISAGKGRTFCSLASSGLGTPLRAWPRFIV